MGRCSLSRYGCRMKKFLITLFIIVFFGNAHAESFSADDIIALSIGKIILFEDACERYKKIGVGPYSSEKHMLMIEAEFEMIKSKLPRNKQIDFLWSIMVRSGFGSHYSERFTEMLYQCCYEEFLIEINEYLENGSKQDKGTIHKAKFVKSALEILEKHHNKPNAADAKSSAAD